MLLVTAYWGREFVFVCIVLCCVCSVFVWCIGCGTTTGVASFMSGCIGTGD